ncbi:MAG: tRNA (N(6)-L-threonylcarbamoyladenosine(37)-C(2))-methylthiotransferase [Nanoarchaeota archaeon]
MTNIYFQTHGCSTNVSESEIMMGLLMQAEFSIVEDPSEADVLIINVCTVKGEDSAVKNIRKLVENNENKKLIVAGCLTKKVMKEARDIKDDVSFVSTHNIKLIAEVVEEVLNDNIMEATGKDEYKKINFPKLRNNPVVGIVPILNSCAGYCSYCSVRYVKGKLLSYEIEDIKREVKNCIHNGCKELWVTSQDNSAYMLDRSEKNKLPELLKEIVQIDGDFLVRVGMMNPFHLLERLDDMIEIYKNKKIFKFLHVPVQSGNDDILKLMKRKYTVDQFKEIIAKFREKIPNITISTDIIVGFPTETEEQFNDSLYLIRQIEPDVINISRYQERPGTEAINIEPKVNSAEIKRRSALLTDIFANISRMKNEKWLGWNGEVLIDEKGKMDTWIGRNTYYKPVVVMGNVKLGDIAKVNITNTTTYDIRGEII